MKNIFPGFSYKFVKKPIHFMFMFSPIAQLHQTCSQHKMQIFLLIKAKEREQVRVKDMQNLSNKNFNPDILTRDALEKIVLNDMRLNKNTVLNFNNCNVTNLNSTNNKP